MSIITEMSSALGIRQTPWVLRMYLTLLLACMALMIFTMMQRPGVDDPARQVLTLSIDSFKIVLGACIGALSMAAQHTWGSAPKPDDEAA